MNSVLLIEIVKADLTQSEIGVTFPGTFSVLRNGDPDADGGEGHEMAVRDSDTFQAMVAWQWTGVHSGPLPFAKAFSTPATITGVTYVDWGMAPDLHAADLSKVVVARFINWADVYAQVGVLPGRQVDPTPA